jgi:peptidoglycan/LPS O-acetylase OafA/YrhL
LGIEEQFYIVWPLLLFVFLWLKAGSRTVVLFLVGVILVVAVNRAMLWQNLSGLEQNMVYTRLDARADALLVGCILGILVSRNLIPNQKWLFSGIKVLTVVSAMGLGFLLFSIPSNSGFLYFGGFTAVALMVAIIIANLFTAPLRISSLILEFPLLRWFGRLSYGLYLWHLPVYAVYHSWVPPFPIRSYTLRIVLPFMIQFLLAVGVATLSFYFVERPALKLKRRFATVRGKGADPMVTPRIVAAREEALTSD